MDDNTPQGKPKPEQHYHQTPAMTSYAPEGQGDPAPQVAPDNAITTDLVLRKCNACFGYYFPLTSLITIEILESSCWAVEPMTLSNPLLKLGHGNSLWIY